MANSQVIELYAALAAFMVAGAAVFGAW